MTNWVTTKCMYKELFEYKDKGYGRNSVCKLAVYCREDNTEKKWLVIATEIDSNPGPSITNSIEALASCISDYSPGGDFEKFVLIENYGNTHDHVTFSGGRPIWKSLGTYDDESFDTWFNLETVGY
jgi:hypothetical protein